MSRKSKIVRSIATLSMIALLGAPLASRSSAQSIDVSLNVFYTNPLAPASSDGLWSVVAKTAGSQGISALDLYLRGINVPPDQPVGPRGTVNSGDPAGFSEFNALSIGGGVIEIIAGQTPVGAGNLAPGEEESVFYGVGLPLANEPGDIGPPLMSLSNTSAIPWATSNPFGNPAWASAVRLASGSFTAGATPAFSPGSSGTVFNSVGTSTVVGTTVVVAPGSFTTIVRTNIDGSPDYNDNGVVDAADYAVWRNSFGQAGAGLPADGNLDGSVNQPDYDFWRANFGMTVPGTGGIVGGMGSGSAVPEPTSMALLLGAAIVAFSRRKSRFSPIIRFA